MQKHESGIAVPSKQANPHAATIQAIRRRSALRKPYGKTPSHITRIEGYIEAISALSDDADVLARASSTLLHVRSKRLRNRERMIAGGSVALFAQAQTVLDNCELRLASIMFERSKKLRGDVIPEMKSLAQKACAA